MQEKSMDAEQQNKKLAAAIVHHTMIINMKLSEQSPEKSMMHQRTQP